MGVYKEGKNWKVQVYYKDWQGNRKRKQKRGFRTKGEAKEWERDFLQQQSQGVDIEFGNFLEIYYKDMDVRLRENTMYTKRYIIDLKIKPYFEKKILSEITVADVRAWQNELLTYKDKNGKGYSPTYLKTVNCQLTAIFNYAMRYYNLQDNPCRKAGAIGKSKGEPKDFWMQEEFNDFLETVSDKPETRMAFLLLYWTGMRIGELLALTYNDINLEEKTISINKSYQRLKGKDMITQPKTPKSIRVITMPDFLAEEFREYCSHLYGIMKKERLFRFTKSHMEHCMAAGIERSGVKRIRLHDLRHSHASMLVDMGVKFDMTCTGVRIFRMGKNFVPTGHKVRRKNYVEIFDKTAISNYCNSCLAGTCSGEYCAGVPGWIICWILLSDSRNLCCDRSLEHWVRDQYGLDNEISDHYDSSVYSTPTYRYGDSCSN